MNYFVVKECSRDSEDTPVVCVASMSDARKLVLVGFSIWFAVLREIAQRKPRNVYEYRRFSLCCILVPDTVGCHKWLKSPGRFHDLLNLGGSVS